MSTYNYVTVKEVIYDPRDSGLQIYRGLLCLFYLILLFPPYSSPAWELLPTLFCLSDSWIRYLYADPKILIAIETLCVWTQGL